MPLPSIEVLGPSSSPAGLRPYPELAGQDQVVSILWDLHLSIETIQSFINSFFQDPSTSLCRLNAKKLVDKSFSLHAPLIVKTTTEVFDHKCHYIIREGKVYFRPIHADSSSLWKEIPFHKKAVHISADGDNLIVLDESKHVYYAKTHSIQFHLTDSGWEATSFHLEWQKRWFNMDIVAAIVNFFKPGELYAMQNARAVAISHRGRDALYHTDLGGKKHPDPFVGITTLYMLSPCGTRIFFADPWLHNKFHNELTTPENGQFIAENMDASASTVFLIQRSKNSKGEEIHKMYTRYADYDSIGANPLLPSTYDVKNTLPLVRILPAEDWIEQPAIPLVDHAHLTKRIAILQTGRGQANRQLRVEGTDRLGHTGYYFKNIYDTDWNFEHTDHLIPQEAFLPEGPHGSGLAQAPPIAHDYSGWIQTKQGRLPAVLKKFSFRGLNERGLHTHIEIELPSGQKISCPLHARRGMRHLFNSATKHLHWTLVTPENTLPPFTRQEVEVEKFDHQILVRGKGFKAFFSIDGQNHLKPNLPSYPLRLLIQGALPFLGLIKFTLKTSRRIINHFSYSKNISKEQERFYSSLSLGDVEDTKQVMQRLQNEHPHLIPAVLMDFLCHPSVLLHLRKLMKGANVLLQGNTEDLFQKLTQIKGAARRISSHPHQEGTCYGLETPLFGELLFWKDRQGNFRLQFEAHSLKTLFKIYYHLVDYLQYKLHGKQQGPYGHSKHTDEAPLVISIP